MVTSIEVVAGIYRNILQREADAGGLNAYAAAVDAGTPVSNIIQSFATSEEARIFVDPIIRFYQAAFGRVPDKGGIDNYVDNFARGGLSLQSISDDFTSQNEFLNLYGSNPAVTTQYVQALYRNVLGREGSATEVQGWVDAARTPGSGVSDRGDVLFGFAQSPEFVARSDFAVDEFLSRAGQGIQSYTGPLVQVAPTPVDTTPPTVTISPTNATIASSSVTTINFAFSEVVTGFDLSDITINRGSISGLQQSASDSRLYTATYTADAAGGTATISLTGAYADIAGNPGQSGSTNVTITNTPAQGGGGGGSPDPGTFSISGGSAAEGGLITFTVTRAGSTASEQAVSYTSIPGTASAGSDYTAVNGALTFAIGATSQTFTVQTSLDELDEPNEEFAVVLSAPTAGSRISTGTANGVIIDNNLPGGSLTPQQDMFRGTANADIFLGTSTTFTAGDSINGLGGRDELQLSLTGSPTGVVSLRGVEAVTTSASAAAPSANILLNASDWLGVSQLGAISNTAGQTVTYNGVREAAGLYIANSSGGGGLAVNYAAGAVASGLVSVLTDSSSARINIGSVTANEVTTLGINAIGNQRSLIAVSEINDALNLQRLDISGTQRVFVTPFDQTTFANVTTVDASQNSAGVVLALTGNTRNITITGGSNNDLFGLDGFNAADVVNGGGGTQDILSIQATNFSDSATYFDKVTNVEFLGITGAASSALDLTVAASKFQGVVLSNNNGSSSVSFANAPSTFSVTYATPQTAALAASGTASVNIVVGTPAILKEITEAQGLLSPPPVTVLFSGLDLGGASTLKISGEGGALVSAFANASALQTLDLSALTGVFSNRTAIPNVVDQIRFGNLAGGSNIFVSAGDTTTFTAGSTLRNNIQITGFGSDGNTIFNPTIDDRLDLSSLGVTQANVTIATTGGNTTINSTSTSFTGSITLVGVTNTMTDNFIFAGA